MKIKKNSKNLNRLVFITAVMWMLHAALMLHCCAVETFGWAFINFGCIALWFTAFINFLDILTDYEASKRQKGGRN